MGRKNRNARKRYRPKPLRNVTLLERHETKMKSIEKIEQEIAAMQRRREQKNNRLRIRFVEHDPLDGVMPIVWLSIGCVVLILVIVLMSLLK